MEESREGSEDVKDTDRPSPSVLPYPLSSLLASEFKSKSVVSNESRSRQSMEEDVDEEWEGIKVRSDLFGWVFRFCACFW